MEKINISVQTLDGILAHNGEMLMNKYEYNPNKTKEDFLEELENTFVDSGYSKKIVPMTLEAAVVRLSDIIAYIGRDIEDSIKVGTIKREDMPKNVTKILGDNNSKIVDTLIKDIIENSMNKQYLIFSEEVFKALVELLDWKYKEIYASKLANKHVEIVEECFYKLYYCYLNKAEELESKKELSQSEKNLYDFIKENEETTNIKRIIIDYIAGETDQYFLSECVQYLGNINIEELYK